MRFYIGGPRLVGLRTGVSFNPRLTTPPSDAALAIGEVGAVDSSPGARPRG